MNGNDGGKISSEYTNANQQGNFIGRYRWTICALLFFATTINYLDRQVISLVKPDLDKEFGWSKTDYANITAAFQFAYAIALLFAGRIIDRIGTKFGYALSLILWSISAMCHGFIRTTTGFFFARGALGITEAGNFPAAIKATAEWFPKKERAFATGIFNSGANIGAIVAPLTVPFIAYNWGWRSAFVITGAIGLIWLIFWFIYYEIPSRQKRLKQPEFEYIHSDKDASGLTDEQQDKGSKVSWFRLFQFRQTWTFAIGKVFNGWHLVVLFILVSGFLARAVSSIQSCHSFSGCVSIYHCCFRIHFRRLVAIAIS